VIGFIKAVALLKSVSPNNWINLTMLLSRFVHLASLVHAQTAPITHCRLSKCWMDAFGARKRRELREKTIMNNLNSNQFDFNTFKVLFNKIMAIGIGDILYSNQENKILIENFVNAIGVDEKKAADSFYFIFSEEFMRNTNKWQLRTLFSGLANYFTNFVNLHQYQKQTVITNKNIARTYIAELVSNTIDYKVKIHYTNICLWLDKITKYYAIKNFEQ